jgi:hypothetical protein
VPLLNDQNENYSMCRNSSCPRYEASRNSLHRAPRYKPECILIFTSSTLNNSPTATKLIHFVKVVLIIPNIHFGENPSTGTRVASENIHSSISVFNYRPTATILILSAGSVNRPINMNFHDLSNGSQHEPKRTSFFMKSAVNLLKPSGNFTY